VSLGETASSADLGGSSKYSNENFEDIYRKGIGLIFPNRNADILSSSEVEFAVTQLNSETSAEALGRVIFSC